MENKVDVAFHMAIGKYLGYPECCVLWFIDKRLRLYPNMAPLTPQQHLIFREGKGFLPCPVCAEKVTALKVGTLITNRQCPTPYPKFRTRDQKRFIKEYVKNEK